MRARTIKPGFFSDEALADCSPLARILFAGLWCLADRDGKLHDKPRQIKAEVLPYEAIPDADALLIELAQGGVIVRYEANGTHYIKIPGFGKHQNPHPKEKSSEIPEPDISAAQPNLSAASSELSGTSRAVSVSSVSVSSHSTRPRKAAARVGVGSSAYPAVQYWTTKAWPSMSNATCSPPTGDQIQRLVALVATHGSPEVTARMDRAVADPFWRDKLDLAAFIDKFDRFAPRTCGPSPPSRGPQPVGKDFSVSLNDLEG